MAYRKFLFSYLIFTLIIIGLYSTFIYIKDTVGFFHLKEKSSYYHSNGRFQMPAFIKNLEYETIIIGPSMSQNFDEKVVDSVFKTKTLNGSISASSAKEQFYVYKLANSSQPNLKNVFWEMNFDSLHGSKERVNEDSGDFPTHFYTKNSIDDVKYLFSYFAGEAFVDSVKAEMRNEKVRSLYDVYKFGNGVPHLVPDHYRGTEVVSNNNPVPEGLSLSNMKESFDENIYPVLKDNPNHNFKLFYTPYSILYQIFNYNRSEQAFKDRLLMKEYVFKRVNGLKNVEIYDFQTEKDITFNLNNYVDDSHYYAYINNWMATELNKKTYLQNKLTTKNNNEELLNQVENFSGNQIGNEIFEGNN